MRVLLINPPWYVFQGAGFNEFPMGLGYVAAALAAAGHETAICNADRGPTANFSTGGLTGRFAEYQRRLENGDDPAYQNAARQIREFRPEVVGIHVKTGQTAAAAVVARLAREQAPGCRVVAGGPHATLRPAELLESAVFDAAVIGEGERTAVEYLAGATANGPLPGLAVRRGEGAEVGPARLPIDDLDALPPPARERLIDKEIYHPYAFGVMFSARGCPFGCSYCASKTIWGRRVRYRDPENIVAEMAEVRARFRTTYFNIRDDTFTLKKERTLDICERIRRRLPGVVWRCDTRADCLDEERVAAMAAAGCVQISIGIESGDAEILAQAEKGETLEQIAAGFRLAHRRGISTSAFIMFGFPGETEPQMRRTIAFARGCRPDFLVASILTPYPGTAIWDAARAQGLVPERPDWQTFFHQSPLMGLSAVPRERFLPLVEELLGRVDRYNQNPWRLLRRFFRIARRNPRAAAARFAVFFTGRFSRRQTRGRLG